MAGPRTRNRGFTLIELLIVVAVIGVLAAIAIPSMAKYRLKAYNTAALSDLTIVKTLLEMYYSNSSNYP